MKDSISWKRQLTHRAVNGLHRRPGEFSERGREKANGGVQLALGTSGARLGMPSCPVQHQLDSVWNQ